MRSAHGDTAENSIWGVGEIKGERVGGTSKEKRAEHVVVDEGSWKKNIMDQGPLPWAKFTDRRYLVRAAKRCVETKGAT